MYLTFRLIDSWPNYAGYTVVKFLWIYDLVGMTTAWHDTTIACVPILMSLGDGGFKRQQASVSRISWWHSWETTQVQEANVWRLLVGATCCILFSGGRCIPHHMTYTAADVHCVVAVPSLPFHLSSLHSVASACSWHAPPHSPAISVTCCREQNAFLGLWHIQVFA